jgi:hypothetical protein
MMPSPSIHGRSNTRLSCWLSPGSAHTRVALLECPAIAPAILPHKAHDARSPLHAYPRSEAKTAAPPLRCNPLKLYAAAKSP